MSIAFDSPLVLLAAFIAVPVYIFLRSKFKNPFALSIPLGAPGGVPFKPPRNMAGFIKFLAILEYIGIFLLFASAAGPSVKTTEVVWRRRGADVLFVLDISPSMAALDMDGKSRFEKSVQLILQFAQNRPADSIGLVAVGNDAALLVPPTTDRQALHTRLERLRIAELGDGTAIGNGLATAAYHLEKSAAKRKAVVLITDGENNAGAIHPETAASALRDIGSLWVIGVGSGGEVPIDYVDPVTRMRRTGVFDSRFDAEALRRISVSGGGTYIPAPSAETFALVFAGIDEKEMIVRIPGHIEKRQSVGMPVLICGFAMLVICRFIRRFVMGAWQ